MDHKAPASSRGPNQRSCIIEFDGASKGNPGHAGAGAVVRLGDGTPVARLSEGVGYATNNVAEYRGVLRGLKYAKENGFKNVTIQGDSELVCKQIQGQWRTRNPKMAELRSEVDDLKDHFTTFQTHHVKREYNSAADIQANRGVHLDDGEVYEEYD